VINGLTDRSHPCQILADLMTIEAHRGPVTGKRLAWIGDGNNVCASFIHAAGPLGYTLRIACPGNLGPDPADLARARAAGADIEVGDDPRAAVADVDAVITDTWVSMGETGREAKIQALGPYQVDQALMRLARPDALFLHCLPAHRGEEVTAEVIDGPQSVIWDEAENRIHAQKAVLAWCFGAV
jgi:ornithine carbamoyltransferase